MNRRRRRKTRSRPPSLRGTRSSRRSKLRSTGRNRPSRLICLRMPTWTITMTSTVTMWPVQVSWAMARVTIRASTWTTCWRSTSSERRTVALISSLKMSFYSRLRQQALQIMVAKVRPSVQDSREDRQPSCETRLLTHMSMEFSNLLIEILRFGCDSALSCTDEK